MHFLDVLDAMCYRAFQLNLQQKRMTMWSEKMESTHDAIEKQKMMMAMISDIVVNCVFSNIEDPKL